MKNNIPIIIPAAQMLTFSTGQISDQFNVSHHPEKKMGFIEGSTYWSPEIPQEIHKLNERIKREADEAANKKLNRMMKAFGWLELKGIPDYETLEDKIQKFYEGKEGKAARDRLREEIKKRLDAQEAEKKQNVIKGKAAHVEPVTQPLVEVYERKNEIALNKKNFRTLLLTFLSAFAGEDEGVAVSTPEKFLIKYQEELDLTLERIDVLRDQMLERAKRHGVQLQFHYIDAILSIILQNYEKLSLKRLALHGYPMARQTEFLTDQLFLGINNTSMTFEKYNACKKEISKFVKKGNLINAVAIVVNQQLKKNHTGDAWISGLTHEQLPFAFIADGCFHSDDYTQKVLQDFFVTLIPQATAFLHEADFIALQSSKIDPEITKNIADIVKKFVFKAMTQHLKAFYGTGQRSNLAGFVEYEDSSGQRWRFWLALGDAAIVTLNEKNSKWDLIHTWPGVKQIASQGKGAEAKDIRYDAGVYLPIDEKFAGGLFASAQPVCPWEEQVMQASSARIDVVLPGDMMILMTDGFYQGFLEVDIKQIPEVAVASARFEIKPSEAGLLSSIARPNVQGGFPEHIKKIRDERIAKNTQDVEELLKDKNMFEDCHATGLKLREFLQLPVALYRCADEKSFSSLIEEYSKNIPDLKELLAKISDFPQWLKEKSVSEQKTPDFQTILDIAAHSVYGPFLTCLEQYRTDKSSYGAFKEFLTKAIQPYSIRPAHDIEFEHEFKKYEENENARSATVILLTQGMSDDKQRVVRQQFALYAVLYKLPAKLFLATFSQEYKAQSKEIIREFSSAREAKENILDQYKEIKKEWIIPEQDDCFNRFIALLRSDDFNDPERARKKLKEIFDQSLIVPERVATREEMKLDQNIWKATDELLKACQKGGNAIQEEIKKMGFGDDALCGYVISPLGRSQDPSLSDVISLSGPHLSQDLVGKHSKKLKAIADDLRNGKALKGDFKGDGITTQELTVRQFYLWEQMKINSAILKLINPESPLSLLAEMKECCGIIQSFFVYYNLIQHNWKVIRETAGDAIVLKAAVQSLAHNMNLMIQRLEPKIDRCAKYISGAYGDFLYEQFKSDVGVFKEWCATNQKMVAQYPSKIVSEIEKAKRECPGIIDLTKIIPLFLQTPLQRPLTL